MAEQTALFLRTHEIFFNTRPRVTDCPRSLTGGRPAADVLPWIAIKGIKRRYRADKALEQRERMMIQGTSARIFWLLLALWGPALFSSPAPAAQNGPIAGAGPNQRVDAGAKVTLAGNGRVADGRIVRFLWTQTGGPRVALRNSTRSTANFTAPKVKTITPLTFRLTVTDNQGRKGSGVVTVTVVPPNQQNPPQQSPT